MANEGPPNNFNPKHRFVRVHPRHLRADFLCADLTHRQKAAFEFRFIDPYFELLMAELEPVPNTRKAVVLSELIALVTRTDFPLASWQLTLTEQPLGYDEDLADSMCSVLTDLEVDLGMLYKILYKLLHEFRMNKPATDQDKSIAEKLTEPGEESPDGYYVGEAFIQLARNVLARKIADLQTALTPAVPLSPGRQFTPSFTVALTAPPNPANPEPVTATRDCAFSKKLN